LTVLPIIELASRALIILISFSCYTSDINC